MISLRPTAVDVLFFQQNAELILDDIHITQNDIGLPIWQEVLFWSNYNAKAEETRSEKYS